MHTRVCWADDVACFSRTVMKSGSELVKAGVRTFFENAAEDLEKTVENLKLGKMGQSRTQMKGVAQIINYTSVALLPILTALFHHITEHHFGVDLLCKWTISHLSHKLNEQLQNTERTIIISIKPCQEKKKFNRGP